MEPVLTVALNYPQGRENLCVLRYLADVHACVSVSTLQHCNLWPRNDRGERGCVPVCWNGRFGVQLSTAVNDWVYFVFTLLKLHGDKCVNDLRKV